MPEQKSYPKLKYKDMEPPGGWVYRDIDTNVWMASYESLEDLVIKCVNHRRFNNLAIPERFSEFVEASICYRVDPTLVTGLPEDRDPSTEMLTLFKVNKYTTEFLQKWKRDGQKMVDIKEATARAATCVNCKNNNRHICLTCKGIDSWIYGWNQRKTAHDNQLGICQCDAVILFATVHAQDTSVTVNGGSMKYPEYCWKFTREKSNG